MGKTKFIIVLLLAVSSAYGQFGNEWITSGSPYVKLQIAQDGVYRLTPEDLSNADVNLGAIDPRSFRLIRRGKDWAIRVRGESDGVFSGTDFLEFYGKKQDAFDERFLALDTTLMQPDYSCYTDTASYFLTWGGLRGKRIETDLITNTGASVSTLKAIHHDYFSESYLIGDEPTAFIFYSEGSTGEGWSSRPFRDGSSFLHTLLLDKPVATTKTSTLKMRLVGANNNAHQAQVLISSGSNSVLRSVNTWSGKRIQDVSFELPSGFINTSSELKVEVLPQQVNGRVNFVSVVSVTYLYETPTDLGSLRGNTFFELGPNQRANLSLPAGQYELFSFEDSASFRSLGLVTSSVNFANTSASDRSYYVHRSNTFKPVAKLEKVTYEPIDPSIDYILISHESLFLAAEQYASYKRSPQGNARKVGLFEIGDLYNQFSFGDKNPIAIKRLVKYLHAKGAPRDIMLLGSGLSPDYDQSGVFYRKAPSANFQKQDLVPTFGSPGSDLLFSTGIASNDLTPLLGTGRLPTTKQEDVLGYIEKLKEHAELTFQDEWTKNVLHLSGGKTSSEAISFSRSMDSFKAIIEGEFKGATVSSFTKKTDLPIEFFNISQQVNQGVALISYLGHSSPNTIEIDIGTVSQDINGYRNQGRYPILFLNGCNSADVYRSFTTAEDWINTPKRGAVGVFGHSSFGYSRQLSTYTDEFYQVAFRDSAFYGGTMGDIQRETNRRFQGSRTLNALDYTHLTQWSYFGDPDVKLIGPKKSDYYIQNNQINLNSTVLGERLTANSDSLELTFDLMNAGKVESGKLKVCVTRLFNNFSESFRYDTLIIDAPAFKQSVNVHLFNEIPNSNGENFFEVVVDCANEFDELNEFNNLVSFNYNMPANGVELLYPYPFAIIDQPNPKLTIQSQDLSSEEGTRYLIQLSNQSDFSNLLVNQVIKGSNVAQYQAMDLPLTSDTTVFYWRSRLENSSADSWVSTSFAVIDGKTGWGQFEYGQFKENQMDGLVQDDLTQTIDFDSTRLDIKIQTVGGASPENFVFNTSIVVGEKTILGNLNTPGCNQPSFLILGLRGSDLSTFFGESSVGYTTCGFDPRTVASFQGSNRGHLNNMNSLLDSVPTGDYILMMSVANNTISNLDSRSRALLAQFGNTRLADLPNGTPYAFIGRKGADQPLYEFFLSDISSTLSDSVRLSVKSNLGSMKASGIGKSNSYQSWHWAADLDTQERFNVSLGSGSSTLTGSGRQGNRLDAASISSDDYLFFDARFSDGLNQSASELKHWAVCYQEAPEGVVVPSLAGLQLGQAQEIEQGQPLKIRVPFVNVSASSFEDSLSVRLDFRNLVNGVQFQKTSKIAPLAPSDTVWYTDELSLGGINGLNQITLTFNSNRQLEQNYLNNSVAYFLDVKPDVVEPLLEIYVNGEIIGFNKEVAPNTLLNVVIKDDNLFGQERDTVGIELFLAGPCQEDCTFRQIFFSEPYVTHTSTGEIRVNIALADLQEGQYYFRAKGSDASGNTNSEFQEVSFFVNTTSEMSYFIPYPSPFSSQMRFAYTLRGSKQPASYFIQIVSADGQVVREVSAQEIGELEIGQQLTKWSWDGTDSNGKPLANGVYLYRMVINDPEMGHLRTEADKNFKKGWGTLLIAR